MSRETGDLVSETLSLDHGDVVNDALIYMEVVGQPKSDTPVSKQALNFREDIFPNEQ